MVVEQRARERPFGSDRQRGAAGAEAHGGQPWAHLREHGAAHVHVARPELAVVGGAPAFHRVGRCVYFTRKSIARRERRGVRKNVHAAVAGDGTGAVAGIAAAVATAIGVSAVATARVAAYVRHARHSVAVALVDALVGALLEEARERRWAIAIVLARARRNGAAARYRYFTCIAFAHAVVAAVAAVYAFYATLVRHAGERKHAVAGVQTRRAGVEHGRSVRGQTAVDELGGLGARAGDAHLSGHAVCARGACVAALVVGSAALLARALAVVIALRLVFALAHVERARGGHASLAVLAVARLLAFHVARLERAPQQRIAIGVEEARRGQLRAVDRGAIVVAARDDRGDAAARHEPDPHARPRSHDAEIVSLNPHLCRYAERGNHPLHFARREAFAHDLVRPTTRCELLRTRFSGYELEAKGIPNGEVVALYAHDERALIGAQAAGAAELAGA